MFLAFLSLPLSLLSQGRGAREASTPPTEEGGREGGRECPVSKEEGEEEGKKSAYRTRRRPTTGKGQ